MNRLLFVVGLVKVDFSGAISLCHTFSTVGIVQVKKFYSGQNGRGASEGGTTAAPDNPVLHTIGEP